MAGKISQTKQNETHSSRAFKHSNKLEAKWKSALPFRFIKEETTLIIFLIPSKQNNTTPV